MSIGSIHVNFDVQNVKKHLTQKKSNSDILRKTTKHVFNAKKYFPMSQLWKNIKKSLFTVQCVQEYLAIKMHWKSTEKFDVNFDVPNVKKDLTQKKSNSDILRKSTKHVFCAKKYFPMSLLWKNIKKSLFTVQYVQEYLAIKKHWKSTEKHIK